LFLGRNLGFDRRKLATQCSEARALLGRLELFPVGLDFDENIAGPHLATQ